jgi:hypothetical protein
MRPLLHVIDRVLNVAPDLKPHLESLRSSVEFSAPEMMSERWSEFILTMNEHATDHPKRDAIEQIIRDGS